MTCAIALHTALPFEVRIKQCKMPCSSLTIIIIDLKVTGMFLSDLTVYH